MHRPAPRIDGVGESSLSHPSTSVIAKQQLLMPLTWPASGKHVYGLLHSHEYRARFADNVTKELPRIPCVKSADDFWAFSRAGHALAELHLGYEAVAPYPEKIDTGGKCLTDADYRVEKMRYGKQGKETDLTTLHYNDTITLTGIPLEAYDYVVNGKPALTGWWSDSA